MNNKSRFLPGAVACLSTLAGALAHAGTLQSVEARGALRCGVSQGLAGFSAPNAQGQWEGIDVELCKGIAVAIFNDPSKVIYSALTASERFTALQSGEVDLLSRNTTWSATRDNSLGLTFPGGVTFYDGQAFMVKRALGVTHIADLDGATVCVTTGTLTETNLADYFDSHCLRYQAISFDEPSQSAGGFDSGRCDVLTSDSSQLAALRLQLSDPDSAVILPEMISKEPLAPLVRRDDESWGKLVSWTLYAMLNAEELGVTSENAGRMRDDPPSPDVARLLGRDGNVGEQLGLDNEWAFNVISTVGNYAEIYQRTVGDRSALNIPRGINALWNAGGIQYAPPIR